MSRYYTSDPENLEPQPPSICASFLRYTWKTITCLFSHITLVTMVVSYCILGAFTFERLERDHEKEVKKNISRIRQNITDELWNLTLNKTLVLREDKLIINITDYVKEFERSLLDAITKNGWDGDESTDKVQWSLAGALFYSIIVITTIGYGHIAPKTQWGKVVTIFYAILGIPLMLLCLSNIGDIMATSFRFLYWKICCYVCTKKPKRPKRVRTNRGTLRIPPNRQWRSRTASFRRSGRTSTRSADSGFQLSEIGPTSYSDTELRYHDDISSAKASGGTQPRTSQRSRYSDTAPPIKPSTNSRQNLRGGSLDRRRTPRNFETAVLDAALLSKTPVLCNKYAMDQIDTIGNHLPASTSHRFERNSERVNRQLPSPGPTRRAKSMPRSNYLEPPREPSPPLSYRDEIESSRGSVRRKRQHNYNPSPRIMSPLGYGHRNKYLDDPDYDDEYYDDYYDSARVRIKPVPIWLCVFLVVSYIIAGMFLFHAWEEWDYLDAAYFCFITLTTIGFGDLFPAKRVKDGEEFKQNIAFCSLYLLFGIALLAMSFNLVQEEVIANVKRVARTLGIIKHEEDEDEDD